MSRLTRRQPKGILRLHDMATQASSKPHRVEVRAEPRDGLLQLWMRREDCKPGPTVRLALDEARVLQRTLQAAVDELYRQAKLAAKEERRALLGIGEDE